MQPVFITRIWPTLVLASFFPTLFMISPCNITDGQSLPIIIHSQFLPNTILGQYLPSRVHDLSTQHQSWPVYLTLFMASIYPALVMTSLPNIIHEKYLPNIVHDQYLPNIIHGQSTQHYSLLMTWPLWIVINKSQNVVQFFSCQCTEHTSCYPK